MTRILIATSSRHTPVEKPSGHIITYDLEMRKVLRTSEMIEPPYRVENPNPRGGLRGSKGISIKDGMIAISNASTIFIYDENWKPLHCIYHPSCAGVHDIVLDGQSVWVTSARNDILCQLNFDSKLLKYFDTRKFAKLLELKDFNPAIFLSDKQIQNGEIDFRDPRSHDEIFADSTHTNGLSINELGEIMLSLGLLKKQNHQRLLYIKNWLIRMHWWETFEALNKFIRTNIVKMENRHSGELVVQPAKGLSSIFKITPSSDIEKVLVLNGATAPSHSVRYLKDGSAIWLKTTTGELYHFDHGDGKVHSITQLGQKFLRGAYQLEDGTILLGDNNRMIHFDLAKKEVLFSDYVSDDNMEAIFDLHVLPENVSLPPLSFVAHHEMFMPIDQLPKFRQ